VVSADDRARLTEGRQRFEAHPRRDRAGAAHRLAAVRRAAAAARGLEAAAEPGARGREVARRLGRLMIADDVGLGKTLGALAAVMDDRFCRRRSSASRMSRRSGRRISSASSPRCPRTWSSRRSSTCCRRRLLHLQIFQRHGWVDIAATGRFRSVIFDEVQNLRHGIGTPKGAAAKVFADNAALRLGLSATPVFGYGGEMFNICDIIEPGILGTRDEFARVVQVQRRPQDDRQGSGALGAHLRDLNFILREVGRARRRTASSSTCPMTKRSRRPTSLRPQSWR
jgi:hypothetical protein